MFGDNRSLLMRVGALAAVACLFACGPSPEPQHGGAGGGGGGAGGSPVVDSDTGPEVGTAEPGDIVIPRAAPSPSARRVAHKGRVTYAPRWKSTSFRGHKKLEDRIVGYVNVLRKQKGLSALKQDERLRVAARQHTLEMIAKGYYSHTSPVKTWSTPAQRACQAGFFDPYVSENIGKVAGFADPAFAMYESWRKSPGHYANMVQTRVQYIGVGVTAVSQGGRQTYFGTQLFATNALDLRKLQVAPNRRKVLRLTVGFAVPAGVQVKAWMGRRFVADVPKSPGGARFVIDLSLPRPGAITLDFAVKVGNEIPMLCVHTTVAKDGSVRTRRNTYDRRCKRITGVTAEARKLTVTRRVLSGEARANVTGALKTRFYLNHQWGPRMKLQLGKWIPFTRALPGTRTRLSFVVGSIMKDYLWIDLGKTPAFHCL